MGKERLQLLLHRQVTRITFGRVTVSCNRRELSRHAGSWVSPRWVLGRNDQSVRVLVPCVRTQRGRSRVLTSSAPPPTKPRPAAWEQTVGAELRWRYAQRTGTHFGHT